MHSHDPLRALRGCTTRVPTVALTKLSRYDIIKPLGKGAMGIVYEGFDPNLGRSVALKTIRVDQLSDEMAAEYEQRFLIEARAAGRLTHPNIISVYDAGRDQGMQFIVMELVRGGDLKDLLDQHQLLPLERSMAIIRELLAALSYAHEEGIIHRDIKPANVMLDERGRVKLGDFGVARITDSGEATRTQGSMVGTVKYMSPEAIKGQKVDARTDLFAAGVVLYQLLTRGAKPFDGDTDFAIMTAIAQKDPIAPSMLNPALPPGIDAVVATALAKEREHRFASAEDFALALRAVARRIPVSAHATHPEADAARTANPPSVPPSAAASSESQATTQGDTRTTTSGVAASVSHEMELEYWKDIRDSEDHNDFIGFLKQFPTGVYADRAHSRLRRLGGTSADSTGSESKAMRTAAGPLQARTTVPVADEILAPAAAPPTSPQAEDLDRTVMAAPSAALSAHRLAAREAAAAQETRRRAEEAEAARIATEKAQTEQRNKEAEAARIATEKAQTEQRNKETEAARVATEKAQTEQRNKETEAARVAAEKAQAELRNREAEAARVAAEKARAEKRTQKAEAALTRTDDDSTRVAQPGARTVGRPQTGPGVRAEAAPASTIDELLRQPLPPAKTPVPRAPIQTGKPAAKGGKGNLIAIGVAVALLAGGGIWWLTRGSPPTPGAEVPAPATPSSEATPPTAAPPARRPSEATPAAKALPTPALEAPTPAAPEAKAQAPEPKVVEKPSPTPAPKAIAPRPQPPTAAPPMPKPAQATPQMPAPNAPAPAPMPAPPPATTQTEVPQPPVVAPTVAPAVPATPAQLYDQAQKLESANSERQAISKYRAAADQGHGPSMKRLWELYSKKAGHEQDALNYQRLAWERKVPGVPEPKNAYRQQ